MNRPVLRLSAVLFVAAVFAPLGACGSDPAPARPSKGDVAPSTYPYSYKFFVEEKGAKREVSVIPQDVANALLRKEGAQAGSVTPASTTLPPYTSWMSPYYLLIGAASECGMVNDPNKVISSDPLMSTDPALQDIVAQEANGQRITGEAGTLPFSSPTSYYIFPRYPASCDEVLEDEETLVCVADKIAQLADTIGPLRWRTTINNGTMTTGTPPVTWVMPPPAENEKFILRDLAIAVLGQIPLLDAFPFQVAGAAPPPRTCSALYAAYDAQATKDPAYQQTLFGSSTLPTTTYPPLPTPASNRTIAKEREAFEAGVLRASGQLLHDLVRESVYSDLAGSAAQAAAAADPRGGQSVAYGLAGDAPYNSLSHAARTLLARLESESVVNPSDPLSILTGILDPDPACHGVNEVDLFSKLADVGTRARARDLGATTSTQATAEALFEQSGIVLADQAPSDLAATLTTQLIGMKARVVNVPPAQFATMPGGLALAKLVSSIPVADLARAADHNRATFAMLTGVSTVGPNTFAAAAAKAGLVVETGIGNAGLGPAGIAITGGLPRALVTVDPMARTGAMIAASQCSMPGGLPALELDEATALAPNPCPGNNCPTPIQPFPGAFARQDVFALGHSIRSRLVKLREQADASAAVSASSTADAKARAGAVAELTAWAGGGRAVLSTDGGDNQVPMGTWPTKIFLDLIGVSPADLGVAQLTDLLGSVSLVVEDPKLAECAAKLTTSVCNAATLAASTLKPTSISFDTFGAGSPDPTTAAGQTTLRARYGLTGGYARLTFAAPANLGGATDFQHGYNKPLFVVAAQDPSKSPGLGQVVATLRLPFYYNPVGAPNASPAYYFGETSTTLSPMRRELLYDAFGIGKWIGAAPPQAGELSASGTPSFCIEGVRRDLFVPLQNDLTSDQDTYENSWRHHLVQAQTAAQRADDIGQTMVDIGLENDTNIENAAAQLLTISGSPTNVDDLSIDANGNVSAGPANGALGALLGQPTIDVVFFASDPLAPPSDVTGGACQGLSKTPITDPTLLAKMTSALGCAANPTNPMCVKMGAAKGVLLIPAPCAGSYSGASDPTVLTYTALNLAKAPPPPSPAVCNAFIRSAAAMKGVSVPTPAGAPAGSLGPPTYSASTKFDDALLTSGLQSWGGDGIGVQGALQRIHMTIRDDASWIVTSGGALVMDSNPGPAWPGCLDPASTTPCNWSNPLTDSLNDLLRACPAGTSLRSPLGQCDGGQVDYEVNSLRWRVEGTLWLAAMMAGGVPAHMFTSPVPAANMVAATPPVPPNMYFVNGQFTLLNSTTTSPAQFVNGGTENDVLATVGGAHAVPVTSRWFHWNPATVANELPAWLRSAYSTSLPDGTPMVHLTGDNTSGRTDFTNQRGIGTGPIFPQIDLFLKSLGDQGGALGSVLGPFEWKVIARQLAGRQCASPIDPGGASPFAQAAYGDHWVEGLVAAIKTSQSPASAMRGPYLWNLHEKQYAWTGTQFVELGVALIGGTPTGSPAAKWFDDTPLHWTKDSVDLDAWPLTPPDGTRDARSLSTLTVDDRVQFAVNSRAPNGDCDAAWQLTQAIAMSCVLDQGVSPSLAGTTPEPPQLTTLDDLASLSLWLKFSLRTAATTLQSAYVERVPGVVVANAVATPGSLASVAGSAGTDIIQAANAMLDLYAQWNLVMKDADGIANAVDETRNAIAIAATEEDIATVNTSIQRLATIKAMAEDVAQIAKGVSEAGSWSSFTSSAGGAGDIAAGAAGLVTDGLTMPLLDKLDKDTHQLDAEKIQQALYTLHDTAVANSTAMTNALIAARQDANNITAGTEQFATAKAEASYYAGKALGANVWVCAGANGTSTECISHVNTVLNRRYAGQQIRYQSALKEAKALGYVARRAIEQRIGVRLSDITTKIGPLEPPSTWADDVCHLTGINYKRLRSEISIDAGEAAVAAVDAQIAGEFADSFIGDYMQKLSDFVDYYNLAYPEADGNDVAVLSMRESLVGGKPSCLVASPNLLSDPARLFALRPVNASPVSGWTFSQCPSGASTCLHVEMASGAPPTNVESGGATWLSDRAPQSGGAGAGDAGAPPAGSAWGPDNMVSQQVTLDVTGTYLLSWWDQARDPVTGRPSTIAVPYRVAVYDSAWNLLAAFADSPTPSDGTGATWSPRHVLKLQVTTPDVFHVAFAASTTGGAAGSVAIADPQLELATSNDAPTPYVNRGGADPITAVECPLTSSDLRAAFKRSCDASGACFYDLQTPFTIDTQKLTSNGLSLAGKIASGNYNFRHVDVAVNVAGTGVIDCSQTGSPDCQGSGYLAYELTDDATNVGVLGFDGQYRKFDFGSAAIEHGKALTSERYITTPISSTDQQLINQFLKTELRGRPIDGTYRLRIYDSPALRFDHIDDIQLILDYHYWSRIAAPQNAN